MRSISPIVGFAAALASLSVGTPAASGQQREGPPLESQTLEQLMDLPVLSPSRTWEPRSQAPATVIVVTRQEIDQRGYGDLSELLDDLPGMDVVRPRGATFFKDYWRGLRNNVGSPYLLLLDGVELNHLYFGTDDVLVALPLTDVARVEVVYGPASAVYGPNAFAGVIQVITQGAEIAHGASAGGALRAEVGQDATRRLDGTWRQRVGAWTVTAAARASDGELDSHGASGYAFTAPSLLSDRRLWGRFTDDPRLGGQLSSPERQRGVDLRAFGEGLEAAVQYFRTVSGYGYEYAFDDAQPHAVWWRGDWSSYLRWNREFGRDLTSTALLRYRQSTVDEASDFVEAFDGTFDGRLQRLVDYSRWRADNSSWMLSEDLELRRLGGDLVLLGGGRLERKDLQKAYATAYGPSLPPALLDPTTYPFPNGSDVSGPAANRIITDVGGIYGEAKWRLRSNQLVHLGLRWDDSSQYGSAATVRAGYAGTFGRWGAKALYGEGFQEPNPRVLYGGWRGSGSDPSLAPERSRSWEGSLTYAPGSTSHLVSLWQMDVRDTIVILGAVGSSSSNPGARNLGNRRIRGLDYHLQARPRVAGWEGMSLQAYYSHLFTAAEERFTEFGQPLASGHIGDLAANKAWLGATVREGGFSANLRARWIGERRTVPTNPVRRIGAYELADLYLRWRLPCWPAASLGLKVTNLFDRIYYEPGVRDAAAGATAGAFDDAGQWHGSASFFNSLLPQPGRQVGLVLHLGADP